MGYLREVCLDLSVSLLRLLHAKWLECEEVNFIPPFTPLLIKMGQQCWGHPGRRDKDSHTPYPNTVCSCATALNGSFGCFDYGIAEVLISLLNIGGTRRC